MHKEAEPHAILERTHRAADGPDAAHLCSGTVPADLRLAADRADGRPAADAGRSGPAAGDPGPVQQALRGPEKALKGKYLWIRKHLHLLLLFSLF